MSEVFMVFLYIFNNTHLLSGMDFFATHPFPEKGNIGFYNGMSIYESMLYALNAREGYREEVMGATV